MTVYVVGAGPAGMTAAIAAADNGNKVVILEKNEKIGKKLYITGKGKTCPTEILEAIASINAEGRPIWKPMHMQPIYRMHEFITRSGSGRAKTNAYIAGGVADVGADIFERGLCLPSDNKMTAEQQDVIIEVIKRCFD